MILFRLVEYLQNGFVRFRFRLSEIILRLLAWCVIGNVAVLRGIAFRIYALCIILRTILLRGGISVIRFGKVLILIYALICFLVSFVRVGTLCLICVVLS